MEKPARTRLLDAALDIVGAAGAGSLTVRAAEDGARLPHGSVRHHFGDRQSMVAALFGHLADRELDDHDVTPLDGDPAAALEHWLGPGRLLTLARYELFLIAARDPTLREPLVRARERFVDAAAAHVERTSARTIVAAIDGLLLDGLVRGDHDPQRLRAAVVQITNTT